MLSPFVTPPCRCERKNETPRLLGAIDYTGKGSETSVALTSTRVECYIVCYIYSKYAPSLFRTTNILTAGSLSAPCEKRRDRCKPKAGGGSNTNIPVARARSEEIRQACSEIQRSLDFTARTLQLPAFRRGRRRGAGGAS